MRYLASNSQQELIHSSRMGVTGKFQWKKSSDNGKLERAFCQFIMSPICKMFEAIMEDKKQKIQKMLNVVGVTLKGDEKVGTVSVIHHSPPSNGF